MGLKNLTKRYRDETKGNVSLMFATSFSATLVVIGAALDFAMISKSQQKLQDLSDAAALAALKYDGTVTEKKDLFEDYVNSLSKASGSSGNIVASNIEIEETEKAVSLRANVSMPFKLFVLNGFNDFNTISATTESNIGIENIEIALVLDISSSMNGDRIEEAKKSAALFVDQILGDESLNGRVAISLVPFGGTVRVPSEMEYLLEIPEEGIASYSKYWIDAKWNQCLEFDTEDIENGIDSSKTFRATPDYWSWNANNPWCPREGNEFMPLTDDLNALNTKLDNLTLSDGTGSDHGMLWGYETLNDNWKNKLPGGLKDTPAENKSATKKVLVFMTDGGITSQHYLKDYLAVGEPPFNSKRKVRVSYNNSLNAFYNLCEKAKSDEIEIFTIGYTITNNKHLNPLKTCATSSNHFIDAATGDLEGVFEGLASAISPLRLSN